MSIAVRESVTHARLVELARGFLSGRGCDPIYVGRAFCVEVPDAIGWSHRWDVCGSIVVECKMSVEDFLRDKRKRHVRDGHGKMGTYRYFLTPRGVITADMVEKHFPDHGLLYPFGSGTKIIRQACGRLNANMDGEVRYLRQAIVNIHTNLLFRGLSFDKNRLAAHGCSSEIDLPKPDPRSER